MQDQSLRDNVIELFRRTERAHADSRGGGREDDVDWPIWYAEHLQEPLRESADLPFVKSRLIYCLINADYERTARAPESDWAEYVSRRFVECYAPSPTYDADRLALYYLPTCPFCIRVQRVIDRLGIDVELRDIGADPEHRADLVDARGRATVPVLKIDEPAGGERWMPESLDIIDYLERNYGRKAA